MAREKERTGVLHILVTGKRKIFTVISLSLGLIFSVVAVLLYPYESGAIPEWRIQVIDSKGHPVANVTAHQEWLDPIEEGSTLADGKSTDSLGVVAFPKRVLHSRLIFGLARDVPSAHIFVGSKAPWDVICDALPQFEAFPAEQKDAG